MSTEAAETRANHTMLRLVLVERECFCKGFRQSRKPLDPEFKKKNLFDPSLKSASPKGPSQAPIPSNTRTFLSPQSKVSHSEQESCGSYWGRSVPTGEGRSGWPGTSSNCLQSPLHSPERLGLDDVSFVILVTSGLMCCHRTQPDLLP